MGYFFTFWHSTLIQKDKSPMADIYDRYVGPLQAWRNLTLISFFKVLAGLQTFAYQPFNILCKLFNLVCGGLWASP